MLLLEIHVFLSILLDLNHGPYNLKADGLPNLSSVGRAFAFRSYGLTFESRWRQRTIAIRINLQINIGKDRRAAFSIYLLDHSSLQNVCAECHLVYQSMLRIALFPYNELCLSQCILKHRRTVSIFLLLTKLARINLYC